MLGGGSVVEARDVRSSRKLSVRKASMCSRATFFASSDGGEESCGREMTRRFRENNKLLVCVYRSLANFNTSKSV